MFNRALHVQLVRPNRTSTATDTNAECSHIVPDEINKIIKEQVKHTAIAVVAVFAAITALSTASEIAINAAPKKH